MGARATAPTASALANGAPETRSSARLLTADELAERWQVSKQQVYRLGREGRIPVVSIGRYMRFREASIEAWEQSQEGATDG